MKIGAKIEPRPGTILSVPKATNPLTAEAGLANQERTARDLYIQALVNLPYAEMRPQDLYDLAAACIRAAVQFENAVVDLLIPSEEEKS